MNSPSKNTGILEPANASPVKVVQSDGQAKHIVIIGVLFFIFGFISWLNAVLIPYFQLACQLTTQQAMLVTFAFYISYLIMAFPSSWVIGKTGYKNGIVLGLLVMALGALVFIPAAMRREYSLFLLGLFVQATGLTIMQTAANPYVTILGPIESAAMRMSVMGVCNKLAGAIAPLLFLGMVSKDAGEIDRLTALLPGLSTASAEQLLNELSVRLITPYITLAVALAALGILIRFASLPDISDDMQPGATTNNLDSKKSLLDFPHLILGAVAVFCSVSVEVIAVDTIISYSQFQGAAFKDARFFSTYALLIMIFSYIVGIVVIPKRITQRQALLGSSVVGAVFSVLAILLNGQQSVWMIACLGFGNALIWPSIWPLALDGLGRFTRRASALLITGIVGGALSPLLYGTLSDRFDPRIAYVIMVPLYIFLFFYAIAGYKAGKQKMMHQAQPL
ncbi:MAG: sugar MFS transporter [Dyadobacter fermentans]